MYYIFAIIPKDITLVLQTYVITSKTYQCKFITEYNNAILNNKILGRNKVIFNCGGLDAFNIILLAAIDCDIQELNIYRSYYKTNVGIYMDISNKILEFNH